ncbi:hypothetical protein ABZ319_40410, partial [Nocardia sp. NPDC005978]|uniref:hypothetical protein n=1 Tax=Nocardia sp. NPDC005978 TaxID=3156725 RepID=UPI0033AF7212
MASESVKAMDSKVPSVPVLTCQSRAGKSGVVRLAVTSRAWWMVLSRMMIWVSPVASMAVVSMVARG